MISTALGCFCERTTKVHDLEDFILLRIMLITRSYLLCKDDPYKASTTRGKDIDLIIAESYCCIINDSFANGETMDQINNIELIDPNIYPDLSILENILGKGFAPYIELLEVFRKHELNSEWKYYKDGKAWLCKVQYKKKTIAWMSAWKGFIKATVYIPESEIENIYKLEISQESREFIMDTNNVGKSKPCMFELKTNKIFPDLEKIMEYKIAKK